MATIESGLVDTFDHDLASIFGRVYRVNGWNEMSVWDGFKDSAVAAGIAAPSSWDMTPQTGYASTAAQGGSVDVGIHLFRYRYVDGETLYVSDPSPAVQFDVTQSTSSWILSNINGSPDSKVDRIAIEMTDAGGETFFVATALANATGNTSVRIGDAALRGNPLSWDNFGHDTPPFFSLIEQFKGRLWGLGQGVYDDGAAYLSASGLTVYGTGTTWTSAAKGRFLLISGDSRRIIESVVSSTELLLEVSADALSLANYQIISKTPDILHFSKALFPESWPPENQIRVFDSQPEKARALKGWRNDLVLFGERSMERLVFGEDPFRDGSLEPVQGDRGAANRRVVVDVEGALFSLDYKGIHRFVGATPEHLSEPIDPLFDLGDRTHGYVDFAYRSTFHAVHYPDRHQILWFVVLNGDPNDSATYTKPHHAIALDYMKGTYSIYKFDEAIVASTSAPGSDGTTQTLLADENGRLWVFGIGTTDGVHSDSATSFTVGSGTTRTNIVASGGTLYASGDGLQGAFAFSFDNAEAQRIASNSAGGLTLAVPFSSAPSVGTTVSLGRIPSTWKSKAFYAESPSFRRWDGRYLHLYYEPKSSGSIRVKFYLDRSTTAYDDYSEDFSNGAVDLDADNDYFTVDLSVGTGYARIPLPGEGSATIEFEVVIVDSDTSFEMLGFELDMYVEEEDMER